MCFRHRLHGRRFGRRALADRRAHRPGTLHEAEIWMTKSRSRAMKAPPKLLSSRVRRSGSVLLAVDGQQQSLYIVPGYDFLDAVGQPIDLVASPDREPWRKIPDLLTPYPGSVPIPAGEIVVPAGSLAEGYTHVVERHQLKIAHFHPRLSTGAYLRDVLRHFQRVYRQPDGSLWLLRTNGITKCAVVAPVILDGIPAYKLITAYPLPREPNFTRRGAIRLRYG